MAKNEARNVVAPRVLNNDLIRHALPSLRKGRGIKESSTEHEMGISLAKYLPRLVHAIVQVYVRVHWDRLE